MKIYLKYLTNILLVGALLIPNTSFPSMIFFSKNFEKPSLLNEIKRKSHIDGYFRSNVHREDVTDLECLAFAIYGEARGEKRIGMTAVAFVIHNRLTNRKRWNYDNYCNVVTAKGQFSFKIRRPKNDREYESWNYTLELANHLIVENGFDKIESPVHNATFFNSLESQEEWMGKRKFITKIGNHYFYA